MVDEDGERETPSGWDWLGINQVGKNHEKPMEFVSSSEPILEHLRTARSRRSIQLKRASPGLGW